MEDMPIAPTEMRKLPLQDRSRARLEAIRTAATEIILEQGLPKLGIREVARRADVNIATFYQFFANKTTLLRALSETYMDEMRVLLERVGTEAAAMDIEAGVSHLLSNMTVYYRANPAYLELWLGGQANPELRGVNMEDSYRNAKILEELARHWAGGREIEGLEPLMLLLNITSGHVFRHAVIMPEAQGDALVAAHRDMVVTHLKQVLES